MRRVKRIRLALLAVLAVALAATAIAIAQTGAPEPAYMTAMEAGRLPGDGH